MDQVTESSPISEANQQIIVEAFEDVLPKSPMRWVIKYMTVHLMYTLPLLAILLFAARPFLHYKMSWIKILFLCSAALVWTTPWDNYIIHHNAWGYCDGCVVGTLGYVPIEEYMFFVIQSIITATWTLLITQLGSPTKLLRSVPWYQNLMYRVVPVLGFAAAGVYGWLIGTPATHEFYLGSILWWVTPVLALQFGIAGPAIFRQLPTFLMAVVPPTLYLCWVDTVAIGAGTWYISAPTSTGAHVVEHLPVEEALFFILTNVMLVSGMLAADRTLAILKVLAASSGHGDTEKSRRFHDALTMAPYRPLSSRLSAILEATLTSENSLDQNVVGSFDRIERIIAEGSKSFSFASKLLPFHSRVDFLSCYAFCRVADDIVDEGESNSQMTDRRLQKAKDMLNNMMGFLDDEFDVRLRKHDRFDETELREMFSDHEVTAFSAFRSVTHLLPRACAMGLLKGFEWDRSKRPIETEADLVQYSKYVASTVGEMCTYIMVRNATPPMRALRDLMPLPGQSSRLRPIVFHERMMEATTDEKSSAGQFMFETMLRRAVDMGVALQVLNICRDIRTDATMGRCYVPQEWLPILSGVWISRIPLEKGTPSRTALLSEDLKLLRSMLDRLLVVIDGNVQLGEQGIDMLPAEFQAPIRIALRVYAGIGEILRRCGEDYPTRAVVPKWRKVLIMLKVLYLDFGFRRPRSAESVPRKVQIVESATERMPKMMVPEVEVSSIQSSLIDSKERLLRSSSGLPMEE